MLTNEDREALISYRKEKAEQVFIEAVDNARLNHWSLAANRLYYALFHIATALLINKGINVKSHAGVICALGQQIVNAGLLSKDDARLVSKLQHMRQSGDYDDLFDWEQEDVEPYISKTRELIDKISAML